MTIQEYKKRRIEIKNRLKILDIEYAINKYRNQKLNKEIENLHVRTNELLLSIDNISLQKFKRDPIEELDTACLLYSLTPKNLYFSMR
jgi:hypothetical protein